MSLLAWILGVVRSGRSKPLSRFSREREGPAKREGEGLYTGVRKILTSQAFGLSPSSPVRTGEGF
ncbi:MAG: hypothetical protein ACXWUZ_15015, partial [Allosphingosinicella sp.]